MPAVVPLLGWERMKVLITIAVLLSSLTNTFAQSKRIGAYQFRKSKGKHTTRIVIRNEPFDSAKHKVGYDERTGKNLIDGRVAYGAEAVPERKSNPSAFISTGEG